MSLGCGKWEVVETASFLHSKMHKGVYKLGGKANGCGVYGVPLRPDVNKQIVCKSTVMPPPPSDGLSGWLCHSCTIMNGLDPLAWHSRRETG